MKRKKQTNEPSVEENVGLFTFIATYSVSVVAMLVSYEF
jgi:hypothetical protein